MKIFSFIITFFLFGNSCWSQISYEKRVEIDLIDDYINEDIIEFGELGFIMSSLRKKQIGNEHEWKYELFNSNLKSVKSESIMLSSNMYEDETFTSHQQLHTLFRNRKGNFSLVNIEASTLEVTMVNGVLPKKSRVNGMVVLGDYAYLKASIRKAPFLISMNLKTGNQEIIPINIPGLNPKKTFLEEFQVLENSQEIFLYLNATVDQGKSDKYMVRLNNQGKKEAIYNLTSNISENIIEISASKLSENKYVFVGTYSAKNTSQSEGLFFCQAEKERIEYLEFYPFLKLENFLSYLPEKRQEKIEKKRIRKQSKGKELKLSYRIAAHEVIKLEDGYLFLGEAYYPTYRTETYTTTSVVNGVTSTTTQTRQVFDGYQYTHAILSRFDKQGKLVWDEIFEMYPSYKPFTVKQLISISDLSNQAIKLVFASRNKIVARSIDYDGKVLLEKQSEEIETNFDGDKSKATFSNIDFWYGNYFIAYGQQKIKNTNEETDMKKKRKVYFISKIKFE